jgi:predicted outer membrane repeat protein
MLLNDGFSIHLFSYTFFFSKHATPTPTITQTTTQTTNNNCNFSEVELGMVGNFDGVTFQGNHASRQGGAFYLSQTPQSGMK